MENQPTKLDKAVKISIIVGALIVALSIAYYLVIFLPQKETVRKSDKIASDLLEKQKIEAKDIETKTEKCFIDAKKFHEDYIKTIGENYQYFEPLYAYNKNLNKCLYGGGYTNSSRTDWEREVKDVYTNETLLSGSRAMGSLAKSVEESTKYYEDFWNKYYDLMGKKK